MPISIEVANDVQTIAREAGEAQSTVIPPGKKPTCPRGRFLVSIDLLRPPARGLVVGRDLDALDGPLVEATFDPVPDADYYAFGTNDHDLVSLSNGDLLYITGAFSRMPLPPKPAWFDAAYRGRFGPGARSVALVWRSTDGGATFRFVSEIDPAREQDGSGALPQYPRKTTTPGSPDLPVFDMGGSDGQLVKVNVADDRLYLTFQCVGYGQDTAQTGHFELSQTRLNKTLVLASIDGGASWTSLGFLGLAYWRFGIVPLRAGQLAFAASNLLTFGNPNALGGYDLDRAGIATPTGSWGWDQATFYDNPQIPKALIGANIWASTVAARSPGSNDPFLVFPSTVAGRGGQVSHGYRLFFFDQERRKYAEAEPILPAPPSADNFLMHLTAVDLDAGPVLLYWYDVDGKARTATIRGRLVTGPGAYSADFAVARAGGAPRAFALDRGQGGAYWYGDYLTAGGHAQDRGPQGVDYHYHPMWVEPDRAIRHTRVTVRAPLAAGAGLAAAPDPQLTTVPAGAWALEPQAVDLQRFRLQPQERRAFDEHLRRRYSSRRRAGNRAPAAKRSGRWPPVCSAASPGSSGGPDRPAARRTTRAASTAPSGRVRRPAASPRTRRRPGRSASGRGRVRGNGRSAGRPPRRRGRRRTGSPGATGRRRRHPAARKARRSPRATPRPTGATRISSDRRHRSRRGTAPPRAPSPGGTRDRSPGGAARSAPPGPPPPPARSP